MTGSRHEAEDIIQESFIKVFQNLKQLKDKAMFGGWLRKIVINTCIRHTKSKVDLQTLHSDADVVGDNNPEWFKEADYTTLHNAIKKLPEGCAGNLIPSITAKIYRWRRKLNLICENTPT